jgi:hypothetical protein
VPVSDELTVKSVFGFVMSQTSANQRRQHYQQQQHHSRGYYYTSSSMQRSLVVSAWTSVRIVVSWRREGGKAWVETLEMSRLRRT